MVYALPQFNQVCQAKANFNFALGANPVGPFILVGTPCNLAYSRRVHPTTQAIAPVVFPEAMYLLLPIGTALKGRGSYAVKNGDAVEVPQGSGRWYSTISVDKVALGFTNEHVCALIVQPVNLTVLAPLWP